MNDSSRELRVRLVDEHDRLLRHARRDACESRRSGTDTPVGLFGLVMNTMRVAGVIAGEHLVERKREVRLRHHLHEPAADDRGVEREDLERRLRDDGFGHDAAAGRRPQVARSPRP